MSAETDVDPRFAVIRALRREGLSFPQIREALDLPVSRQRVFQIWSKYATAEDIDAAATAREDRRCLARQLASHSIATEAHEQHVRRHDAYRRAVEAWNAGAHHSEVAALLGLPHATGGHVGAKMAQLRARWGYDVHPRGIAGRVYDPARPRKPSLPRPPKTHCVHGHPLSGDNLAIWGGRRYCRICTLARRRRTRQRRKAGKR
jgi:hypothetical protein